MRIIALATVLIVSAVFAATTPVLAQSACDITDLSCWGSGKKCNIKFLNQTGKGSGAGGSQYNQVSWAATIKVLAVKPNGTRAGSNSLSILAGQSKTINLDKKKGFDRIKVYTTTAKKGTMMIPCADIRATLTADNNCRIFADLVEEENSYYYLAYNCGGGVTGKTANFFWVF
jgi:hypothetical protein